MQTTNTAYVKPSVYEQLRPPVACDPSGQSPVRRRNMKSLLINTDNKINSRNEQIIKKFTDDGKLIVNDTWNARHHVTPSGFNSSNHRFFKQYFDKNFRDTDKVLISPQRVYDPYQQNEIKGTRMPDYSKAARDRDIYGELGWVTNFNVKFSKNNDYLHPSYREFFDEPKNQQAQFSNMTLTNTDFFRKNAPKGSVATRPAGSKSSQSAFAMTSDGFRTNKSGGLMSPQQLKQQMSETSPRSTQKMMSSTMRSNAKNSSQQQHVVNFGTSPNKYKVNNEVQRSIEQLDQIPFLRKDVPYECIEHNKMFGRRHVTVANGQLSQHDKDSKSRRERGWENYVKPISRYNEKVHPCMRVPFEKI